MFSNYKDFVVKLDANTKSSISGLDVHGIFSPFGML